MGNLIYDPFEANLPHPPRFDYYRHFRTFFERFEFHTLKPDEGRASVGYTLERTGEL